MPLTLHAPVTVQITWFTGVMTHKMNDKSECYLSAEVADNVDSCLRADGGTVVENRLTADAFSRSYAARISSKFSYFNAWTSCRRYRRRSCRQTNGD